MFIHIEIDTIHNNNHCIEIYLRRLATSKPECLMMATIEMEDFSNGKRPDNKVEFSEINSLGRNC